MTRDSTSVNGTGQENLQPTFLERMESNNVKQFFRITFTNLHVTLIVEGDLNDSTLDDLSKYTDLISIAPIPLRLVDFQVYDMENGGTKIYHRKYKNSRYTKSS